MARLIDADALDVHSLPMDMGGCLFIDDVTELIANAPTIDSVKQGHWKHHDFTSPILECSVCGGLAGWDCCGDYPSVASDFCPNCGAKMNGIF